MSDCDAVAGARAGRVLLVSNVARLGLKRAVSAAYARGLAAARSMKFYDVCDESGLQAGILEPFRYAATEYLFKYAEAADKCAEQAARDGRDER